MWLHVPSTVCPSAQAQEVSTLPCTSPSPDIALCVTSSGKPMLRPLSWRGWKTRPWIKLLCGTILRPSMARLGVAQWISSLRESRVRETRSPGSGAEPMTSAGSGPISGELFASAGPDGSFSKTSEGCFLSMMGAPSERFSETWPKHGGLVNGECFRRKRPERTINGNGSSSWPTPAARDGKGANSEDHLLNGTGRKHLDQLPNAVAHLWPTPRAMTGGANSNRENRAATGGPDLQEQVKAWQTPRSHEAGAYQYDRGNPDKPRLTLTGQAAASPSPRPDLKTPADGLACSKQRRSLNPLFVEWLMGWPIGWTDCGSAVTGFPPLAGAVAYRTLEAALMRTAA